MQTQFFEMYRAGMKNAADVMTATFENARRLQQQTAIFNKYDLSRTYWEWHSGGSMSAQNLDYTWKPWVDLLLVP